MSKWASSALVCALALASPALSQEGGTLAKIKANGVISLGVRDAAVPFSYLDDNQRIVGYSTDLCANIVAAVRQKLNLPDLVIKEVTTTPLSRIPLIVNGTVDLECDDEQPDAPEADFILQHYLRHRNAAVGEEELRCERLS